MQYILLDNFNDTLNIVSKDDGSGEPLIFDTLFAANTALEECCQDGQIIPLGVNIIKLVSDLDEFRETIFTEESKHNFQENKELDNLIMSVLDSE